MFLWHSQVSTVPKDYHWHCIRDSLARSSCFLYAIRSNSRKLSVTNCSSTICRTSPNVVPEQCIDGHLLPWDALPQHVIGERGEAEEGLQDGIHVASVAQVGESVKHEWKNLHNGWQKTLGLCQELQRHDTAHLAYSYPCSGVWGWVKVEGLCLFQPL